MTCPSCGSATPDGLLCFNCVNQLLRDLNTIAELWDALEDRLTGQSRTGGGGKNTTRTPLVFNESASETIWTIRNTLQTWIRELALSDPPGNQTVEWCRWLRARVERIRTHADSAQIIDEIGYCAASIKRAVDIPLKKTGCGKCPICGTDVFAVGDDQIGTCKRCDESGVTSRLPVLAQREDLWQQVADPDGKPLSRKELLAALPMFGIHVKPATFRKWVQRKKLKPVTVINGSPRYLLADVQRLASGDVAHSA